MEASARGRGGSRRVRNSGKAKKKALQAKRATKRAAGEHARARSPRAAGRLGGCGALRSASGLSANDFNGQLSPRARGADAAATKTVRLHSIDHADLFVTNERVASARRCSTASRLACALERQLRDAAARAVAPARAPAHPRAAFLDRARAQPRDANRPPTALTRERATRVSPHWRPQRSDGFKPF